MVSTQISDYLNRYRADNALADLVTKLSPQSYPFIESLLVELRPSLNYLRQIIVLLLEIAGREGVGTEAIVSVELWQAILAEKNSRKEKQKELRQWLETKRYPLKQALLEELQSLQKSLLTDHGFSMKVPEELEGDNLTLSLSFASPGELKENTERLASLAIDQRLKEIFDLLLGKK
ncbi:MAG: hypothetical protein IT292_04595 [Deltaproteobacteria bacterium]|nr:hypothetical protein [Deltaproteobacteria bacterium]